MNFHHITVLLEETIQGLNIKPDGVYVDGTLGGGGHATYICQKLGMNGRLIGIDQDEYAIRAATEQLANFKDKISIIKSNYRNMKQVLFRQGIQKADGILLDLGVSSHQLDTKERGFSYMENARLDMRMDTEQELTAYQIVNRYSEEELYHVIHSYGEERYARFIARNIVKERKEKPLETTFDLVRVIEKSMPAKVRNAKGHPAKRTFQAIRIECNRELEVLEQSLDEMIELLNPDGRICIITFQSLEDRIVKNIFRKNQNPCTCPPTFPVCICGKVTKGEIITKKPILPEKEECERNPRAKSAKLRIFRHI
jgi:16S rRNA (cytosine1402-N4)-methyltransferase